jgi:tRNA pseudouridine32 synthase / 23S rRNA pseudouridine746 synthase
MIPVLYDDDGIIAIDKPAGIAVIPERDRTKEHVLLLLEQQLGLKLLVVHRLDKEVSGVMLFAKNPEAHRYLNEEFFKRSVRKTYRALVLGALPEENGEIDKPIRQFGSGRMGVDEEKGKPSLTKYAVLQRLDDTTLVHAFPVSGRRHQIRVHLYHIGHPVAGDRMYGDKTVQQRYPRLMLHAEKIQFTSKNGTAAAIQSDIPEDFQRAP